MTQLLPAYDRLADEERARQAFTHQIDCLPWAPSFAAGAIHLIDTAKAAEAWMGRLRNASVSLLGVDTEFRFTRPSVVMNNGKEYVFLRSIQPLVCAIVAWCAAETDMEVRQSAPLIRLLFDLRRSEVYPSLRQLFGLHVPWIAHSARSEFQCLWACGIEPAEHLLIDTNVTACCLGLGRFDDRRQHAEVGASVAHDRRIEEWRGHVTSLVGQCEVYKISYPYDRRAKDRLRDRFLNLRPDDVLDDEMMAYAVSDAEYALRLHFAQTADVHRYGLLPHLATVEWPLVGVIARMEQNGLPINRDRLEHYRGTCEKIAQNMAERLVPFCIRPGSHQSFLTAMHRAGVLDRFVVRGGYSTDQDTLRMCERAKVHPAITPYRLQSYFTRLASSEVLTGQLVDVDGRLRCSLDQLRSASGRIASSKPNLIGLDKRLRPVVEAPAGWVLIELDYSQKEIGIAGAEWHDDALIRCFNDGDAYAAVAQRFYAAELTPEERSMSIEDFKRARPELRKRVKTLVLGVLYGCGARSIAESFGCSLAHAESELKKFFDAFPHARDGAHQAVEGSLRRGYGMTITGLRRHITVGDDRSRNAMRNHPIQSAAAAIFKLALVRLGGYFRNTETQLLLPRHDSILLLTPEGSEEDVIKVSTILMIQAAREKYPALQPRVDAKVGRSWPTESTLDDYFVQECNDFALTDVSSSRCTPVTA